MQDPYGTSKKNIFISYQSGDIPNSYHNPKTGPYDYQSSNSCENPTQSSNSYENPTQSSNPYDNPTQSSNPYDNPTQFSNSYDNQSSNFYVNPGSKENIPKINLPFGSYTNHSNPYGNQIPPLDEKVPTLEKDEQQMEMQKGNYINHHNLSNTQRNEKKRLFKKQDFNEKFQVKL